MPTATTPPRLSDEMRSRIRAMQMTITPGDEAAADRVIATIEKAMANPLKPETPQQTFERTWADYRRNNPIILAKPIGATS